MNGFAKSIYSVIAFILQKMQELNKNIERQVVDQQAIAARLKVILKIYERFAMLKNPNISISQYPNIPNISISQYPNYICNMFDQINSHVTKCATFSAEELACFNSILEFKTVPKKTILLHEGDVCNFEAYINKGCIRNYYIDENGFEVTLQFAIEDWWVSDIASFQDRTPSNMFIETLEDCELLMLSPQTKEDLLIKVPKLERVFRLMVQRNLSVLQSRLFKTIASTAREKYLDFLIRYPTIPQRVAQHYIASYLGISPEFLSKVRTKMAKKPG